MPSVRKNSFAFSLIALDAAMFLLSITGAFSNGTILMLRLVAIVFAFIALVYIFMLSRPRG
jgi:hypothetical protein